MPNSAQLELLNSFFSEQGLFFEIIRDDSTFNLGTKILYLERAINQDCQTFLESLDKIYNPDLVADAKAANIEFIRALKLINDLCFNYDVKYSEFGTRKALTHYFSALGSVDFDDFKNTIQDIIKGRIAALQNGHIDESTEQKTIREIYEPVFAKQTGWRAELDLPVTQLVGVDVIQAINGALTILQYQHLRPEIKLVIAGNVYATRQLMQVYGLTFAHIQALSAKELYELINQLTNIAQLIERDIKLDVLLSLGPDVRKELFSNVVEVIRLINEKHTCPFYVLVSLSYPVLKEFFRNTDAVIRLANESKITIAYLGIINPAILRELFSNVEAVIRLKKEARIELYNLTFQSPDMLWELFRNADAVIRLINEAHIDFNYLVTFDPSVRNELFLNVYEAIQLVKVTHISPHDFQILGRKYMLRELFRNVHDVIRLVNEAHISLADLVRLSPDVRKELFSNVHDVIRLVNEKHIPFAEILALRSSERLKLFKIFMPVYDVDLGQFDDLTFEKLVVLTSEQLASSSPEKSLRLPPESLCRLSYNKLFNLFASLKDKEFPETSSPPSSIYNPGMF